MALAAYPTDRANDLAGFPAQLPGRAASVACDRDAAILGALRRSWVRGRKVTPNHLCEHRLWASVMKAMRRNGGGSYDTS